MATIVRGKNDEYVKEHPGAKAELYRQNTASIRIRIADQRFAKMSKGKRHDLAWDFLAARLDEDTMQEISVLLLISPTELDSSFMSFEFDHPVKSGF